MRTTHRKYKIRLFFTTPVQYLAENGWKEISVNCRSLRGAEKEAKKYADIIGDFFPRPIYCEIEYKTEEGKKVRKFDL